MRQGWVSPMIALSAALAGCQFIDLGRDLEEMNKFSTISGEVVQVTPNDNPIAVALFSDALQRERLINVKLIDGKEFAFGAPPGDYFLFAFEDKSGDFQYQPSEPAGYYGDPSPVVLTPGADRKDIRIVLRRNLVLPDPEESESAQAESDDERFPLLWAGRKNIGAIANLEDRRFEAKFAQMGKWQPLRFSLELGPGLFMLEPYDPERIPVLFVHGIGGTPRAWTAIIENLDRQRFQPWFLFYASGLPLEANAKYMFEAVTQLRVKHGFESLYLVAHSMGGLLSQAFIERYRAGRSAYLKLLVTLSTPWGGHSAAQIGVDYAPAVVPVWRDMVPASEFLTALKRSRLPEHVPHHLLFSYRGGRFPSSVANDGAVTVSSQLDLAAQARARRIYGFDTSHIGILSDETVIRLLNDILADASKGAV